MLPTKPAADNGFDDQMVRRARDANADAKIQLPFRRHVQVNRWKDLLLLVRNWIKAANGTQRAIVFNSATDHFGKVVRNFQIRRKFKSLAYAFAMQRLVYRRIEGEIPWAQLLVHNGTNFPCPGIR